MAGAIVQHFDGSEREVPHDIDQAAHRNLSSALAENEWLNYVSRQAMVISAGEAPTGNKYQRLAIIAERTSKAVTPHSACRSGCNHCCHIAVVVSEFEAKVIAKAVGVQAIFTGNESSAEDAVERYKGVPCPFLKKARCSIYEHRPIACRLHFSLADTEEMCDLSVPMEISAVPNLNLTEFWLAAGLALNAHRYGDIRDFFGSNQKAKQTASGRGTEA